ncbi:MAG: hypothetical protein HFE76_15515 [Firmicutes bacterium]|nr:hypothetical protein [Bacillota bacterium]
MPLIILGLLVIGGLLAYMYFTGHSEQFTEKRPKEEKESQEETASVIYLPTDIEKEKKRRKVKTGK